MPSYLPTWKGCHEGFYWPGRESTEIAGPGCGARMQPIMGGRFRLILGIQDRDGLGPATPRGSKRPSGSATSAWGAVGAFCRLSFSNKPCHRAKLLKGHLAID